MSFVVRWLITAIAVAIAAALIPGITVEGPLAWAAVSLTACILAFLNIYIKPALQALSCGFMIVTLGLFSLVINAGLLYFSSWLSSSLFGLGFAIDGFWPAFWGGLIISIVTMLLSIFVPDKDAAK